jgi:pimeloyl-ACP methyl ester carboxylesterase
MRSIPEPAITGYERKTTSVNGIKIHYWVGGYPGGTPVLLWHGFLGTSFSWHKVMPSWQKLAATFLPPTCVATAMQLNPAGETAYEGRALAEEFRTLVRQTGFGGGRPLTIVAHDMGGPPALLWAADHRDEIRLLPYVDAPIVLWDILSRVITYTPQRAQRGSL